MTRIAVLVGSLQANSFNKKLAHNLEALAPAKTTFDYVDVQLPLFNQDLETNFPAEVTAAKNKVDAADGVLFVTPEYNRGVPGVLKNAIDWLSRPSAENSFDGKPGGVVGASSGQIGTAVAQSDLRHIMAHLNIKQMGQPAVYFSNSARLFDETGHVVEGSRAVLKRYIDALVDWIDA